METLQEVWEIPEQGVGPGKWQGRPERYSWQGTCLSCPQGRSVEEQCPREVPGGEGGGGSWGTLVTSV